MQLSLTLWNWLLAFLPVLVVVVLMLVFRWGGSRAGGLGWFTALIVAAVAFGSGFDLLAYAQVKAVLLSRDVLFIIWTALLLFNIPPWRLWQWLRSGMAGRSRLARWPPPSRP